MMMKQYLWIWLCMFGALQAVSQQVYNGVYKSSTTNTDYHHLRRNGSGAAVYINQISSNSAHPILRLSSGTADANSPNNVRFTLENNGNLGLGTITPQTRFHLFNGSSGGSAHVFTDLTIEDDDNGMISILTPDNKTGFYGFADATDAFVGGMEYDHVDDMMIFRVNDHNDDMVINKDGFVGIGTTNPLHTLHVSTGTSGDAFLKLEADTDNSDENDNSGIHFSQDGALVNYFLEIEGNANTKATGTLANALMLGTEEVRDLHFINGDQVQMTIKNSGVGIGTTAPDSELTVKGQIHALEVKVDLNGALAPDYVFYEDYDLRSLDEVQKYIDENGHLPNIPSAAEIEKDGLHLKEMNLKLLEKVEELTLYILKQETRIKKLEMAHSKNIALEQKIDRLLKLNR